MKKNTFYTFGGGIALGVLLIVLTNGTMLRTLTGSLLKPTPVLTSCSRSANDFFELQYSILSDDNDVIDHWSKKFTELISELVTAQMEPDELEVECTAETMSEFIKPTSAMRTVLSEWEPFSVDPESDKLSRLDIGYVLTELLRNYECALQERMRVLEAEVAPELVYSLFKSVIVPGESQTFPLSVQQLSSEAGQQREKIIRELAVTRQSIEETVRILNGRERTTILKAELQCLEQASLDIRNATGLAAEAMSCLPRVWNSKDVLTDLKE